MPDLSMSTVKTGRDGTTWIVGYVGDESGRLVVGRVTDGVVSAFIDDRLPSAWPSVLTLGYTVDVAPDGAVWIGSPEGATRFADGTFEFFGLETGSDCCYSPLAVDAQGSVWLLRDSSTYRLVGGVWNEMPPVGASGQAMVAPIVATPDGGIWVFTRDPLSGPPATFRFEGPGWVRYSQREAQEVGIPVAANSEFRAVEAPDGTIVTTETFYRFAADRWEHLPVDGLEPDTGASADWSRRGIAIDSDGSIWVPTLDGAARMTPAP